MEKAVNIQLVEYLVKKSFLLNSHFGYRKHHSRELALATTLLLNKSCKNSDNGKLRVALFIDLFKAFDAIGNSDFFGKTKAIRFRRYWTGMVCNYLFARAQTVKVNETLSKPCSVFCGAPQGSILESTPFLIFFDDFHKILINCEMEDVHLTFPPHIFPKK